MERVDVGGGVHLARLVRVARTSQVAPPVVLLPGTGLTARDWDHVAHDLAAHRTTHAVDLRGHGDSDRPGRYSTALMAADVAALLDVLDEPAVDLVGHSLGGLVALRVAAERPGRVRRLVLEDVGMPHPRAPSPPSRPPGELAFDWAVVEQVRPRSTTPTRDGASSCRRSSRPPWSWVGEPPATSTRGTCASSSRHCRTAASRSSRRGTSSTPPSRGGSSRRCGDFLAD